MPGFQTIKVEGEDQCWAFMHLLLYLCDLTKQGVRLFICWQTSGLQLRKCLFKYRKWGAQGLGVQICFCCCLRETIFLSLFF